MDDLKEQLLPGTATGRAVQGEKGFAKIEILLAATGGLSLSQVCAVTGLEGSTIQNWVKRGWVAHPKGKKYDEIHIARILIINALKECIKLEHIAQLMIYLNGETKDKNSAIVRESVLYNYLCDALQGLSRAGDLSRSGIESLVDSVIVDYIDPSPDARVKIRKALTVMIYACVCTDVKRRTETMMQQVLHDLEFPEIIRQEVAAAVSAEVEEVSIVEEVSTETIIDEKEKPVIELPKETEKEIKPEKAVTQTETRKTVAQALREWDLSRVEDILNEDSDNIELVKAPISVDDVIEVIEQKPAASTEKTTQKPWYFRRS